MQAEDFQRWAATSHKNYEWSRSGWANAPGPLVSGYFKEEATFYASARAADFKHAWRLRFGTPEPEAWA